MTLLHRDLFQNGQLLVVGRAVPTSHPESGDVFRERGRWVFRYSLDPHDVIQVRTYLLGILISARVVPAAECATLELERQPSFPALPVR